ncbi:endonuclease/exonuclease/phosphatase family protein [Alienimonas chondri]|uniref:Endonuclease/exonuclease/phosphatase domain-containing protein n=1 Tax=Alienimonas chondri TaxID=2681879 RepID=A0ABX1VF12_9PLAN|nr:endonuclease/exonuclease/phosphatase family protein [Alienimonas chondri]NNJ26314.1 hypothetical protein [Alienimonas chondri]
MDDSPAEPHSPEPAARPARGRFFWWTLAALPFVPWLIGLAARWWWFAELFTHFRFQWLLGTGAIGLILLSARQRVPLALCGAAALILGGPMLAGEFASRTQSERPALGVVTANVLTRNEDAFPLLAYLAVIDPDVICLQEIDSRWAEALTPLHGEYPHRLVVPDDLGNFGMAIYSREPGAFVAETVEGVPRIRADLDIDGRTLTVFNVHTSPPIGGRRAGDRNRGMANLAAATAAVDGPVLVCGDLNCTPWSPYFAALIRDGILADTRGGGRSPTTWRAGNPLFALPIDHLLTGGGAGLVGPIAGPDIGSDHRPLSGRLHLPQP